MKTLGVSLLVLSFVAAPSRGGDSQKGPAKKPKGKFTVSKETTYATRPLDKEGYIDYPAALNERLSKGVTPANNACVLIWKLLGPHPQGATMPSEYFKWLGVPQPSDKGDYFLPLDRFIKDRLKLAPGQATDAITAQLDRAREWPWTPKDYPALATWLKVNEKPLTVAVQASKRRHYFNPLTPERTKKGPSGLPNARVPIVQRCRELVRALNAQAMLRLSRGDTEGAWQDLLACHRLARLFSQGGILIEGFVGIEGDRIASDADLVWLDRARPDAKRLKQCLDDLRKLPPLAPSISKVWEGERFWPLELALLIDRYGARHLDDFLTSLGVRPEPLDRLGGLAYWGLFLRDIDWDPGLRTINHWYDRMMAVMRIQDRADRERKLTQFDEDVKDLRVKLLLPDYLASHLRGDNATAAKRGKFMGNFVSCLLMPPLRKIQTADDRARQIQDNLAVAFALAWYQRDHGHYPKTLDALTPKYLTKVPQDRFTGKPLDYRPTKDGYLLSCVADIDLSIRIPLSESPGK